MLRTLIGTILLTAATVLPQLAPPTPEPPLAIDQLQPGIPPAGFSSWDEVMKIQERLTSAADEIVAAAEDGSGFGAIRMAPAHRALTLYWKGESPSAQVAQAVRQARDEGLSVDVRPAAYTQRELEAETRRLTDATAGEGVTSVGPLSDASGLRVAVAGTSESALALPAVRESKVHLEVIAGKKLVSAGRYNDVAPFYGGGDYSVPLPDPGHFRRCSTGFAIKTETAEYMMITAAHCVNMHQIAFNDQKTILGEVVERLPSADLALIRAHSAGRVWVGPWDNSVSKPVVGVSSNIAGQYVCSNGAGTGTWCGINGGVVITYTNQTVWSVDLSRWVYHMVIAEDENGSAVAGQGDSGGGVITPTPGWTGVYAKGILSQIEVDGATCNGKKGRVCGSTVYYETIFGATSTWGPIVTVSP